MVTNSRQIGTCRGVILKESDTANRKVLILDCAEPIANQLMCQFQAVLCARCNPVFCGVVSMCLGCKSNGITRGSRTLILLGTWSQSKGEGV